MCLYFFFTVFLVAFNLDYTGTYVGVGVWLENG